MEQFMGQSRFFCFYRLISRPDQLKFSRRMIRRISPHFCQIGFFDRFIIG